MPNMPHYQTRANSKDGGGHESWAQGKKHFSPWTPSKGFCIIYLEITCVYFCLEQWFSTHGS